MKFSDTKAFLPKKIQFVFVFEIYITSLVTSMYIQPTCSTDHIGLTSTSSNIQSYVKNRRSVEDKPPLAYYLKEAFRCFFTSTRSYFLGEPCKHFKSLLTLKEEIFARNHLLCVLLKTSLTSYTYLALFLYFQHTVTRIYFVIFQNSGLMFRLGAIMVLIISGANVNLKRRYVDKILGA